jgi:hypothetical protein
LKRPAAHLPPQFNKQLLYRNSQSVLPFRALRDSIFYFQVFNCDKTTAEHLAIFQTQYNVMVLAWFSICRILLRLLRPVREIELSAQRPKSKASGEG